MTSIDVRHLEGDAYSVTVDEGDSSTRHRVTVGAKALARFGRGARPEDLLAASFRFLLEREPKESILRRFDLPVIQRYFPEYERKIDDYLE